MENPFPACEKVCPSGVCLFRYQCQMLMSNQTLKQVFDLALAQSGITGKWTDMSPVNQVIARFNGEAFDPEFQRSLGLCYGVQRIAYFPDFLEDARRLATDDLIEGYDEAQ